MRSVHDEYDYLIHLVRCAIHDQTPSEIPDGVIFDSVYNSGVLHDVANIAFYSVEKLSVKPQDELYSKWESRKNSAVIRDINQSFAEDEIIYAFKDADIRSIGYQGTRMKALYPEREYRTMSDIDFVIDRDRLAEAREILEGLGYKCRDIRGVEVDGFRRPNIFVELHTELFPENSDFYEVLPDPFDGAVEEDRGRYAPSRKMFYIYNVLHIVKHYRYAGCGIRRILDLYYLNREYRDIAESSDTAMIFDDLETGDFVRDASIIAECWFGDGGDVPERLFEMASVIRSAGVHGTDEKKTENALLKNKSCSGKGGKSGYIIRRAFPKKAVLEERYPVLKKHPVLTPFCYTHRFFRAAVKSRKRISAEIKTIRDTDKK